MPPAEPPPLAPLRGLRVVDLSRYLPGPLLSSILRDLGADVVKVESPRGDALRFVPPTVDAAGGVGAAYAALNAGKRRVVVNARTDEGRATLRALVARADVLIESFRPGVLAGMGLDPDTIHDDFPRLVVCSLSGYGQQGADRHRAGHDLNYVARAGILGLFGPPGRPPQVPGVQLADVAGGSLPGAIAVLAALMERQQTGRGRHLDISLSRSVGALGAVAFAAASAGAEEVRGDGFLTGGAPCYRCYETADGRYLALGALEPHFFAAFCAGVGRPELAEHAYATGDAGAKVAAELAEAVAREPWSHWEATFAGQDVCVDLVQTPTEVMQPGSPGTFQAGDLTAARLDLGAPLPARFDAVAEPVDVTAVLAGWTS